MKKQYKLSKRDEDEVDSLTERLKEIKDEKQSEFMSRCMSDDIMKKEYKDNKQRVAVCLTQYRTRKKSKGEASWDDVRKGDILGVI